jgi:MFS family permease
VLVIWRGWLADRLNKQALLVCGYLCAASAALCVVLGVHSIAGLGLMFALAGTGVGLYEAVEDAVGAELLSPQVRGSGFGALALVTGTGDWLSSVMVGWIWAMKGPALACGCALVLMLLGALWMAWLALQPGQRSGSPTPG